METLQKIYENPDSRVIVNDKFIYCITTYLFWKGGASFLSEKFYSCNKPIKFKKKDMLLKQKTYKLHRTSELVGAPEHWLQKMGYKLVE
jgi:hypothetical protein